ncbi:Aminotransferase swnA [Metarhizium anisopliae]|nr:Aminotransferase swnA [Metarhizium anisopliae]
MDENGLLPDDLDEKLNAWDVSKGRKPFVLYTIPCGQNPTSATQTTERRKAVYEVAVKNDLYIIEDDPYYFLQLDISGGKASSAENYFKHLPSSYLSLDSSGRVLRMDTLSKILAPGLRCGWVTGSAQVIEKFIAYSEVGVLSPSGPSQVMAYKLLDETWGHEGFLCWLNVLSFQYRRRLDSLLEACNRFLPRYACTWEAPTIGMFVWVHLHDSSIAQELLSLNESRRRAIYLDTEERIYSRARSNGVLVSKGSWFIPDTERISGVYFRLTFAAAAEPDLIEAVQRFGNALELELKNVTG